MPSHVIADGQTIVDQQRLDHRRADGIIPRTDQDPAADRTKPGYRAGARCRADKRDVVHRVESADRKCGGERRRAVEEADIAVRHDSATKVHGVMGFGDGLCSRLSHTLIPLNAFTEVWAGAPFLLTDGEESSRKIRYRLIG